VPFSDTWNVVGAIQAGSTFSRIAGTSPTIDGSQAVSFSGDEESLNSRQVLVVPSLGQEAFGVVALEAMACGCVPLVSRSGGLPDAAGAGGMTFDSGDSQALAQAIEELLDDPALLNRLRAASAIHLQRHTRDRVARDYLQVMADACRSSTPHSAPRAV
jgi:glycosyltransferase involved in cell wall biosynthesis